MVPYLKKVMTAKLREELREAHAISYYAISLRELIFFKMQVRFLKIYRLLILILNKAYPLYPTMSLPDRYNFARHHLNSYEHALLTLTNGLKSYTYKFFLCSNTKKMSLKLGSAYA
jgi:hypothetical protein